MPGASSTTAAKNDGALPGTYQVSIIARDADIAKAQGDAQAKSKQAVVFLQKLAAQPQRKAKSLIPTKYESPATLGWTREVGEQPDQINFELND